MSATEQDVRALVHLAVRLRHDTYGCGDWDHAGTYSVFASHLVGMSLQVAMELVTAHATDPEAKTPAAIKRAFTPKPTASTSAHPPRPTEVCKVPGHEGYRATNCGGCHADRLAGDPTPASAPRGDAEAGADSVRIAAGLQPRHQETPS